jgi:small-conductance mechanosensitive channel
MAMLNTGYVKFQVGDEVREGMRAGTVTDVGTMLIQVRTAEGRVRLLCPWELVKTRFG